MITIGAILPLIIGNNVRILDSDMTEICIISQDYLPIVPSESLLDYIVDGIWFDENKEYITIRVK